MRFEISPPDIQPGSSSQFDEIPATGCMASRCIIGAAKYSIELESGAGTVIGWLSNNYLEASASQRSKPSGPVNTGSQR